MKTAEIKAVFQNINKLLCLNEFFLMSTKKSEITLKSDYELSFTEAYRAGDFHGIFESIEC